MTQSGKTSNFPTVISCYTLRMQDSSRRILDVLKGIPEGKVCSYGEAAALAGVFNGARTVVRLLHSSSEREGLPWHRVVKADGRIALPEGGGFELQRSLLEAEGVHTGPDGRVDLSRYRWDPTAS